MSPREGEIEERGTLGPWRFVASPGWGDFLRERGAVLLAERPETGEVLRESRVRTVRRIRPPGVILKVYRLLDPAARLRSLVRRSRARAEWEAARALRVRGVATAAPLAYGELRRGAFLDRCFYLCEEVADALPADRYFSDLDVERGKRLRLLGAFVAKLHGAGVLHGDLHPANLLVRPGASPAFHVVDLHAARRARDPGARGRADDLAALRRGLAAALRTEDEGDALLHGYLAAAHLEPSRRHGDALRRAEARLERRRLRSRGRRAVTDSPEFATERGARRRIHRRREVPRDRLEAALAAHAAARGGDLLDVTPRGRATKVAGTASEVWFVKEQASGGVTRALADLLRGSRGRRAWVGARRLELIGLPAPEALALVEERRGPFVVRSFLVRRFFGDAKTLRAFLAEDYARLDAGSRRAFVAEAARAIGRLTRAGLLHRDLSTKNLLVRRNRSATEFAWIDLEDLRPLRSTRLGPLLRGLAQLNDCPEVVSRSARLRFLRAWEASTGRTLGRREIEWISRRTRERIRRRAARSRAR